LTVDEEAEIVSLIQQLAHTMQDIAIDKRHSPNLWASFFRKRLMQCKMKKNPSSSSDAQLEESANGVENPPVRLDGAFDWTDFPQDEGTTLMNDESSGLPIHQALEDSSFSDNVLLPWQE
jgi:hypothetical protein